MQHITFNNFMYKCVYIFDRVAPFNEAAIIIIQSILNSVWYHYSNELIITSQSWFDDSFSMFSLYAYTHGHYVRTTIHGDWKNMNEMETGWLAVHPHLMYVRKPETRERRVTCDFSIDLSTWDGTTTSWLPNKSCTPNLSSSSSSHPHSRWATKSLRFGSIAAVHRHNTE